VTAAQFAQTARTLLFGYTCGRLTWHVYTQDGQIHRLVYSGRTVHRYEARVVWPASDLVPDKRVYPESTDAKFAQELRRIGVIVPYLPFDEERHEFVGSARFQGRTRNEGFPA
jgi:hypothetical protein